MVAARGRHFGFWWVGKEGVVSLSGLTDIREHPRLPHSAGGVRVQDCKIALISTRAFQSQSRNDFLSRKKPTILPNSTLESHASSCSWLRMLMEAVPELEETAALRLQPQPACGEDA